MGSIRTKRSIKNENRKEGKQRTSGMEWVQFSPVSLLFTIFGLFGVGYIALKYLGSDRYGDYGLILLILGLISIVCIIALNSRKSLKLNNRFDFSDFSSLLTFTIWVFALIFSLELAILSLQLTVRYSLTPSDLMFYYVSTAIIEELFFRMVLCGFFKIYTKLHNIWIALLAAIPFGMVHWEAYSGNLLLILTMYVGGIIFSLFYLYTRDITVTMTAHMIINIITVGTLIIAMGG